ncbi:MAG: 2-C-methyl-D-erythritol 4-phosphate cytidylyltransferase [Planctomycetes bacterium]|nr:2-C-methyl-D-erythritol 4-phosphate cytidylyltransferase [Planctomycetota bacterium]
MSRAAPALVVVAAGSGTRLGAPVRKALVELGGVPLVLHTLRRVLAWPAVGEVVLVVHPSDRATLGALVAGLPRGVHLVDGGARRQDSVAAGVAALPETVDVVLVHDAARPFVPIDRLDALADAARDAGCALLAVPVSDTIKRARGDAHARVDATVPRHDLWAAQTPQAFRRAELLALLAQAAREGREVTDEAGLFESAGRAVHLVEGSRLNFKVTTPDDLALAEALLASERTFPSRAAESD